MKRKIIAALTAAALMTSGAAYAKEPETDSVEIEITIGSDVIYINGEEYTTEPAYTVGDGVTLVPLRTVTEAFGAEVSWDDSGKIVLSYKDVTITLEIGNYTAHINDYAEVMPAAPELMNDTAMIPLRFIAENFDADVDYDEQTDTVYIEKNDESYGSTITSYTDKARIGDSYFNWSMDTPAQYFYASGGDVKDAVMFAGKEIDSSITIFIDDIDEDFEQDINKLYIRAKESMYGYAAIIDSKCYKTAEGYDCIEFETVDYSGRKYDKYIITEEKLYSVTLSIGYDLSFADREIAKAVFDSFKPLFIDGDDISDISNVENGMRLFEHEGSKISMYLPAKWSTKTGTLNNRYNIYSDEDDGFISMSIFYAPDEDPQKYALTAQTGRKLVENTEISATTDVYTSEFDSGITAYCYDTKIDNSRAEKGGIYNRTDMFFKNGDYMYKLRVKTPNEDTETLAKIRETLKAGELIVDEFDKVQYEDYTDEYIFDYEVDDIKFSLASNWIENTSYFSTANSFTKTTTGESLSVSAINAKQVLKQTEKEGIEWYEMLLETLEDALGENDSFTEDVYTREINGNTYYVYSVESTGGSEVEYNVSYVTMIGDKLYVIDHTVSDEFKTSAVYEELEKIIGTMEYGIKE